MIYAADEAIRYLDRRLTNTSVGVSVAFSGGVTTWTLPYSVATNGSEGTLVVCTTSPTALLTTTRPSATQIAAVGNYSAAAVYIGVTYQFRYKLSTIYHRDQYGKPQRRGRLTLRFMKLLYARASQLSLLISREGRAQEVCVKTHATPSDGEFDNSVQALSDTTVLEVVCDGPGGCSLTGLDWAGTFIKNTTRV